MRRVAVTCIQLIRDLDDYRPVFDEHEIELVVPTIHGQHLHGEELISALVGCVGVIAGDDQLSRSVIASLPGLRVISKWGVGVDGIDHDAAQEHGVRVTNTPGEFDDEVADISMAYVIMLLRQLVVIDRGIRSGRWPKPAGTSLRGNTLGVVGLGGIGRALAQRALAAGMTVVGNDPDAKSCRVAADLGVEVVTFRELLGASLVVSINCPLNDATRNLFDSEAFASMRQGSFLVNTGRGAVVNSDDLVGALASGQIAGAALDVMAEEPVPGGHALRGFEQVIFGSHNASNTIEASRRVHMRAIKNLLDSLESESL